MRTVAVNRSTRRPRLDVHVARVVVTLGAVLVLTAAAAAALHIDLGGVRLEGAVVELFMPRR